MIGWNDWPEVFDSQKHPCTLNSNPGYRVYSALGSFFIPLIIMTIVYIEIYIATKRRLRERARASRINAMDLTAAVASGKEPIPHTQQDQESISSETNHNELPNVSDQKNHDKTAEKRHKKEKRNKAKDSIKHEQKHTEHLLKPIMINDDSATDLQDHSTESMKINENDEIDQCSSLNREQHHDKRGEILNKKSNTVYQFIEEKQRISLSKERRAARTLGIIMGVFILCWVPFFILYIVTPFCPSCCPSDELIDFLTWLGYINSALNPIIYTIFNLDYRRAFKKLLGIKF